MTRLVTTRDGIGRLEGEQVVLIDTGFGDVGEALTAGETVESLAAMPCRYVKPAAEVALGAPVPRPPKILIVGKAYDAHRAETGSDPTAEPFITLIAPTAVIGPFDDIRRPLVAPDHVDYEGELGVVIGKSGSAIAERSVWDHVAGFLVCNDVSARDVQLGQAAGQPASVSLAKSFDTFMPMGPALVTLDELSDPADLALRTWVDGELRQNARTSDLIWPVSHLVSFISDRVTLLPGDVISTGTPAGVGHRQGLFLRPGTSVRVEIEGLGAIENRIV